MTLEQEDKLLKQADVIRSRRTAEVYAWFTLLLDEQANTDVELCTDCRGLLKCYYCAVLLKL
jgi:hypothetical protein